MSKANDIHASRRGVLQAGLGLLAVGALAATARAQDAKLAQTVVQYQQTPKNGAQCSTCVNWIAPNACKLVQGPIVPTGWCVAYAPKSS